jgi:hypothetical protein
MLVFEIYALLERRKEAGVGHRKMKVHEKRSRKDGRKKKAKWCINCIRLGKQRQKYA